MINNIQMFRELFTNNEDCFLDKEVLYNQDLFINIEDNETFSIKLKDKDTYRIIKYDLGYLSYYVDSEQVFLLYSNNHPIVCLLKKVLFYIQKKNRSYIVDNLLCFKYVIKGLFLLLKCDDSINADSLLELLRLYQTMILSLYSESENFCCLFHKSLLNK